MRWLDCLNREERREVVAVGNAVAYKDVLQLRDDVVGAALLDSEGEAIEPVRRVPACAVRREAHLDDPRPHLRGRRVDRDRARGLPHRIRDDLVARQSGGCLAGIEPGPSTDAAQQVEARQGNCGRSGEVLHADSSSWCRSPGARS
jgi:hypothetical protein